LLIIDPNNNLLLITLYGDNMKKSTLILILVSLILIVKPDYCQSKQVSDSQSLEIATQFYIRLISNKKLSSGSENGNTKERKNVLPSFNLAYQCDNAIKKNTDRLMAPSITDTTIYFYVYNIGEQSGFIIVSGDDRATPVLGYSTEGQFSSDNQPENVRSFLENYKNQISNIIKKNVNESPKKMIVNSGDSAVSPLITTKWGQETPYNSKIPIIAPTGCGATALAQVMNYYRWPSKGTSNKSYIYNGVTYSADFAATTYDWANMKDTYSNYYNIASDSCQAVATLMYHCGVALSMRYTPDGSFTETYNVPIALTKYFNYDNNLKSIDLSNYTATQWKYLVKSEINEKRPVLVFGSDSSDVGHEFIADGYDKYNFIHINWGWNGNFDGYFETNPLDGSIYFTPGSLIIGIQKPVSTNEAMLVYDGFDLTCNTIIKKNKTIKSRINVYEKGSGEFNGYVGLAIFRFNELISIIDTTNKSFPAKYYTYFDQILSIPDSLKNGTYRIVPVFRILSGIWKEMEFISHSNTDQRKSRNYEFVVSNEDVIIFENSKTMICRKKDDFKTYFSYYDWVGIERLIVSGAIDQFDLLYMASTKNIKSINLENAHIIPTAINKSEVAYSNKPSNFNEYIENLSSKWVNIESKFWNGIKYAKNTAEWSIMKSCENLGLYTFKGLVYDPNTKSYFAQYSMTPAFIQSVNNFLNIGNSIQEAIEKALMPSTTYNPNPENTQINVQIVGSSDAVCDGYHGGEMCGLPSKKNSSQSIMETNETFYLGDNGLMSEVFSNSTVEKIILPKDLKFMGPKVFLNCPNLKSITFPDSVGLIGDSILFNCPKLESTYFNYCLSDIWNQDFSKSTNLSTIILPDSIHSIPDFTFKNCTSFTSMTIPESVKAIGKESFANCTGIDSIIIPLLDTIISRSAFAGCTDLKSIQISSSVKTIEDHAFENCINLKTVYCFRSTPVDLSKALNAFCNVDVKTCKLYVPVGSKSLYQNANVWKDFVNIFEFTNTELISNVNRNVDIYYNQESDILCFIGIDDSSYVTIYDFTGKTCISRKSPVNHSVSLQNFPRGIYLVQIEINNNRILRKILIK
jgi:hypothetical protein